MERPKIDCRLGPETERLRHRAFEIDDADALYALNSDPRVMRYTSEPLLPSLDAARTGIANYPDFDVVGYGRWACILKETQAVIGFCGLKYLPELDAVDVGYRLLPTYWGRGLATEACRASLSFGFETLGLKEILGLVLPENIASIRVLEKSGLKFDGETMFDGTTVLRYVSRRDSAERVKLAGVP
ncbi:MAG: GNAT family N-acetyltransferase [Planctomycetaceae bacterium]|nr:GNAT family N-acetyltransferase [Planctomycetaceae bacterium]